MLLGHYQTFLSQETTHHFSYHIAPDKVFHLLQRQMAPYNSSTYQFDTVPLQHVHFWNNLCIDNRLLMEYPYELLSPQLWQQAVYQ